MLVPGRRYCPIYTKDELSLSIIRLSINLIEDELGRITQRRIFEVSLLRTGEEEMGIQETFKQKETSTPLGKNRLKTVFPFRLINLETIYRS